MSLLSIGPARDAYAQEATQAQAGNTSSDGQSGTPAAGGGSAGGSDPYQTLKLPDTNALSTTPVNFTGWLRRGSTLMQTGDAEGALEALRNAVAIEKDNIVAHILLGDDLVKLHRYGEAEGEYQYVMLRQPTDTSIVLKLGDLYMEQGNFVNAQNMFAKVVAVEPANGEALLKLARSYEGSNDLSSATEAYDRLVRDFPGTEYATAAANRIKDLSKAQQQAKVDKYFPIDEELGKEGLGWWNLKRMPLHVYVDDGSDAAGFRPEMIRSVYRALQAWSAASGNAFAFVIDAPDRYRESQWKTAERQARLPAPLRSSIHAPVPTDPIASQIHVHWNDHLQGAVGLTWTSKLHDGKPIISKAHIWLASNKLVTGQKLPTQISPANASLFDAQSKMMDEVAAHELGHALGLVHLTNPNDIMAPGIVGLRSGDASYARALTERDVKALAEHYDYFRAAESAPRAVSQISQETTDARPGAPAEGNAPAGGEGPSNPGDAAPQQPATDATTPGPPGPPGADETTPAAGDKSDAAKPDEQSEQGGLLPHAGAGKKGILDSGGAGAGAYDPLKEAMFLMSSKQYDKSLDTLNRVLSSNANNPRARYLRACVYVYMRQYPQAASDYKQVLKLTPNSELGKRASEGLKRIGP